MLLAKKNFAYRTECDVTRVNLDASGKRATGVTYVDANGQEFEQPADLVVLCAFAQHNVHLLLLSGIGKPYDPKADTGVVGRNYAYQITSSVDVFLDDIVNPFMGAGALGQAIDEFNGDNFDHGPQASSAAAISRCGPRAVGRSQQTQVPEGTPKWGSAWKRAMAENYLTAMSIATHGSVMSYRDSYLDLDPTYRDIYGNPLLRMTFDFHDNEHRMSRFLTDKAALIAKAMKPRSIHKNYREGHYSIVPYQTTHNTGGAVMGDDPRTSVVNRYLQSWDVPNVFVMGSSVFPQNARLQPDRHRGRADLLGRRRDPQPVPAIPGPLVRREWRMMRRLWPRHDCFVGGVGALCAVSRGRSPAASTATIEPIATQVERGRYLATLATARPATPPTAASLSPAVARSTAVRHDLLDQHHARPRDRHRHLVDGRLLSRDARRHRRRGQAPLSGVSRIRGTRRSRATTCDAIKAYLDTLPAGSARRTSRRARLVAQLAADARRLEPALLRRGEFRADPKQSAQWNRGAYIVEGLGHCGDCHTPKGYFGGARRSEALSGGYASGGHQGWYAPSLAGEQRDGLGGWSAAEIVEYLKTGSNAHAVTAGPMNEVIADSTSRFTDADLEAVAVYLKSLPPRHDEAKVAALDRQALERGQGIFTDQCAACHMHDGGGIAHVFPPLMGSSAIQAREAATVIRVVLEGASVPARAGQRSYLAMPAFGRKLDDQEVADVVNYIRNAWGNRASAVDADTVAKSRQALAVSNR